MVRYRTFQLRPAALEAPELCGDYRDELDYIAGWRAWYAEIDRAGKFWTEEAEKKSLVASKRDVKTKAQSSRIA